jgi:hypothetical protein
MPAYVAQVRRDPDGSGLRVALQAPYKVNVLEAGERARRQAAPALGQQVDEDPLAGLQHVDLVGGLEGDAQGA